MHLHALICRPFLLHCSITCMQISPGNPSFLTAGHSDGALTCWDLSRSDKASRRGESIHSRQVPVRLRCVKKAIIVTSICVCVLLQLLATARWEGSPPSHTHRRTSNWLPRREAMVCVYVCMRECVPWLQFCP